MRADEVDTVLQEALQRLALLAEATTALSSTLDVEEGLRRLCRILLPRLGDWCAADLLDERGRLHRMVVAHRNPVRLPTGHLEGRMPPVPESSSDPLARVLRGAGPLLLDRESLTEEGRRRTARRTPPSASCSSGSAPARRSSRRCAPAARSSARCPWAAAARRRR